MLRKLIHEIKVLIWILRYPNMAKLVIAGVDKESRKIIYDRYEGKFPKEAHLTPPPTNVQSL